MARQPTVAEIRVDNIITCFKPAIALLTDIHESFGTLFVQAIANTAGALIVAIQNVKKNKTECIQLVESLHQVLYAIINLHIKSETSGSLPPAMLAHIGRFTETIHKIYIFVEASQGGNRIKNFFRQSEMNALLKDCRTGVQHALDVFKIDSTAGIMTDLREIQATADAMQQELLELIASVSDATSDMGSSIYHTLNYSQQSSRSFSLLPPVPKIFHGRDSELAEILGMLGQESPRIVILGAGGMGKTSLARAVLHHPDVAARYDERVFVPCDSATTSIDLAALIGAHIGLKPGRDLTKPLLRALDGKQQRLLVLDNVETVWEPLESRGAVEELLSLLTDLPQVALMITMRGAERPVKVRWTRPFLAPLKPLSDDAAWQTFTDIADDCHEHNEIQQLLRLTDNMPLAVDLVAHLVDSEGCASVLARWETEKTSFLSVGNDRGSSLDVSISLGLSSARVASSPGAMDLMRLLSILPDGLSDVELLQSNLPIQAIRSSKVVLLATSLAYLDDSKRLRLLVPIREHMQYFYPAPRSLIQPLQTHFHMLLDLYQAYLGSQHITHRLQQISLNLGNIHQVLLIGLAERDPAYLADTVTCILSLSSFTRFTGRGRHVLMDHIPADLDPSNHKLQVLLISEMVKSQQYKSLANSEELIARALLHFHHLDDPILECRFYLALGYGYALHDHNVPEGMRCMETALALAKRAGATQDEAKILAYFASIKWQIAEYKAGQALAKEARRLDELAGNFYEEARALWIEAGCWRELGEYTHSIALLHRARGLLGLCGMANGDLERQMMDSEAEVHFQKSEYAEARRIHLQINKETPQEDTINYATGLLNIGRVGVLIGEDKHTALQNLQSARALFTTVEYTGGAISCEMNIASLKLREGDSLTAKAMLQRCLDWSWGKEAQMSTWCLDIMGDVTRWAASDFRWTSTCAVVALVHAKKTRSKLALHEALRCLGDVFLASGEIITAENLLTVAFDGFTHMDVHFSRAKCLLRLGDIANSKERGDPALAAAFWTEARPLFERALQRSHAAQIETRLAALDG